MALVIKKIVDHYFYLNDEVSGELSKHIYHSVDRIYVYVVMIAKRCVIIDITFAVKEWECSGDSIYLRVHTTNMIKISELFWIMKNWYTCVCLCVCLLLFIHRSSSSRLAVYVESVYDVRHSCSLSTLHSQMGTKIHETSQSIQHK